MGFRFSLAEANWLATVLDEGTVPLPDDGNLEPNQRYALEHFIRGIGRNFYSDEERQELAFRVADEALDDLRQRPRTALEGVRRLFRGYPWVALLLPEGNSHEVDALLTDRQTLRTVVNYRSTHPGVILQLDSPPSEAFSLENVFPAFRTALSRSHLWPGVLIWTRKGDSIMLPCSDVSRTARERLNWIFSHMSAMRGMPDLGLLEQQFYSTFSRQSGVGDVPLRILHLSDLHLGSDVARRRVPRIQTIVRTLLDDLGEDLPIVPVVTGDIMDTPSEMCRDDARAFYDFLHSLGTKPPASVLGNHDVRSDGILIPNFQEALRLPSSRVVWLEDSRVALLCLNSVRGGNIARGKLGEVELQDIGTEVDRRPDRSRFAKIALLHHHPVPVQRPDWYARPFYERWLGRFYEHTEALEDADLLMQWAKTRNVVAMLHGHKHIPRVTSADGMTVIGCGSSVGKVETVDKRQTYISVNLVTVDVGRGLLSCRLLAERVPGAGIETAQHHEVVFRSRFSLPTDRAA